MNGRTARALRKKSQGPKTPTLNPLSDEAESTRADARKMKFRKKLHAQELAASSHRARVAHVTKWNKAFGAKA